MVSLVEKYVPTQPPAEPERLGDFLRDELERIAIHMAGRDEVVCGTATFAGATVAVTFAREQPDTLYRVVIGPRNSNWNHWVSAKLVSGFTLNSEQGAGATNNVDWAVFRDRDND